jgi:serine/threonine-protein kinase
MLVGQKFGPFIIDKELGSGAMGTVYGATYEKTGQRVALKVMVPGLSGSEHAQARFEREGEILKQLHHPNIVRLYGVGRSHGMRYYAMEYIKGESLDGVIHRRGRLTWEEVATIGRQLCSALQHAHEQGIIHRDLKPSNLMVLPDGTIKLTDFGIAKDLDVTQLTAANCTVGTASYMSPEQCRGEKDMTFKADIYSLGIVFYELLTGQKPFKADAPMEMFLQHIQGTFERPSRLALDVPIWMDTLICQMLEKKPEKRPRDAAVVAEALGRITEKVTAQKSAGVELVTSRAIDRPATKIENEQDRETARSLHEAVTGRKLRQRRGVPFYQRGWFIGIGAVAILAIMAALLYLVFKPPSPAYLYKKAEELMTSENPEDWELAIDRNGPVVEYLRRYGRLDTPQTAQVWQWSDQANVSLKERQLANRMKMGMREGPSETKAQAAIRYEEEGDLDATRKRWEALLEYKDDSDPEQRIWGLLADKHLKELNKVDALLAEARQVVSDLRKNGLKNRPPGELDWLLVRAVHFELFGDQPSANDVWSDLRRKIAENQPKAGFLTLLSAKTLHDQKNAKPLYEGTQGRLDWLKERMDKAATMGQEEARQVYVDIILLYHDSKELADIVKEAQQQLERSSGQK